MITPPTANPVEVPMAIPSHPSLGSGPTPSKSPQLSAMLVTFTSTIATNPVTVSPAPRRHAIKTVSMTIAGMTG